MPLTNSECRLRFRKLNSKTRIECIMWPSCNIYLAWFLLSRVWDWVSTAWPFGRHEQPYILKLFVVSKLSAYLFWLGLTRGPFNTSTPLSISLQLTEAFLVISFLITAYLSPKCKIYSLQNIAGLQLCQYIQGEPLKAFQYVKQYALFHPHAFFTYSIYIYVIR